MSSAVIYRRKRAFIIGINEYPNNSLQYCINDASDLNEILQDLNFLVTFETDPSLKKFYRKINEFAATIERDDLVWIYFACHGKQNDDENYLLPSDYHYDHRGSEHDYIVEHAINVKYIMNKIESRKCRVAIYLFDCCRTKIRTRTTDEKQGLSNMNAPSQTLIVFACAPGCAVQDETRNDRNGSFIENLLKYIKTPNKDIEDIMKHVCDNVNLQTKGFQLPHRASSIVGKVFLVVNNKEKEIAKPSKIHNPFERDYRDNKSNNPGSFRRNSSDDDDCEPPRTYQSSGPNSKNGVSILPPIRSSPIFVTSISTPSDRFVPLQPIEDPIEMKIYGGAHILRPSSIHNNVRITRTPRLDLSLTINPKPPKENRSTQIYSSQTIPRSKICKDQPCVYDIDEFLSSENDEDNDSDSGTDILGNSTKYFVKVGRNPKLIPNPMQSVPSSFQNDSKPYIPKEETIISSPVTPIKAKYENNTKPVPKEETIISSPATPIRTKYENNTKPLVVRIRTLFRRHCVKVSIKATMQDLMDAIWSETQFDMERYTKASHFLLLFNHRLHIFVDSDPFALVNDFLSLSPPTSSSASDPIDFYVYGLPLECVSTMYNLDDDCITLFGNPNSWCPSYFTDYKQSQRSQSILLSSLYTLRLYFRPENRELMAKQLAMEAQFFLQLRKYFFPPAILALKHAITGCMFWFEKSLLIDALIQLLSRLCDPNIILRPEIFDFIPLLFCWLLEKCDATAEIEDCFRNIMLINDQTPKNSYFQNPVTTSKNKRQVFLLEEFDRTGDYDDVQHHVDIRSLTLYLARLTKNSTNVAGKYDDYVIYDPVTQDFYALESLTYWTETDIKELYKTMVRTSEYRSFNILTRGTVTADVRNQLVLLDKDRTVALLFSPKNVIRPNGRTPRDVDHFYQIFDPLICAKDTPCLLVSSDTFLDEKEQLPDPRLPLHFNNGLCITNANVDRSQDHDTTVPASQVSIILLDRSRSMSDYRITSSDKLENCSHIDICKMMLGRLSDNILSTDEVHAFGYIEFATNYKTVCPITRSREQFEKALSFDDCRGDWTCMYDALREAIRQIKTFTDSPIRARKDCKKLIICLSDGINNSGDTTITNLHELINKNSIVIDFISFIRDNQLKSKQETTKAQRFRELCIDSSGHVYQNLCLLSNIEIASVFEQEAAVWLSKRSKTSRGLVDKPEREIPSAFKEEANRQSSSNKNIQSSSRLRRVLNEFQAMLSYPSGNVTVFAIPNNVAFWKLILKGPENTPYQGRFWMLYVEFDSHYPNCPPNVRFLTPIYHVNISGDGKICHQVLGRAWCLQTKMSAVFENILDLLKNPNFDDAMSQEKAHLYRENPNDYNRQAVAHSNKYAKKDIETLKAEYQLEDND